MVKQKIAAIAASVLAVCSISATALAAGVYPFSVTLVEGDTKYQVQPKLKNDSLYAVTYVDSGLESGDKYATFSARDYTTFNVATDEVDLWVNSRAIMNYKTGYGIKGKYYHHRVHMDPQANAHQLTLEGTWTP